ncbi:glycerol dehydratase reactivase beta/small subunit family protein [Clostridium sp. JNZ X4-2]
MIDNANIDKPHVNICLDNPAESLLKEILAGLEEEGIPYQLKNINFTQDNIIKIAYEASEESRMGIAIAMKNDKVVLHYNKLKENHPLINVRLDYYEKDKARVIGCNAARLYKIMPLKSFEDTSENELRQQVKSAVISVLKNFNLNIS